MKKNTLVLLGILGILIVVALLLLQRPGERSVTAADGERLFVLDSAAVDKVEIQSPTSSVVMEKRGSEWFVVSPVEDRADQNKIALFIRTVRELTVGAVVSTNPGKRSLFQVDSTGTFVRLYQGGSEAAAFVIGKMSPGFSEVYVRKEQSPEVVIAAASVAYDARRSPNDWRDHALVNIPLEAITEVRFQYGDTTFTLARRDTAWTVGNKPADLQKVNSLLSALSSLQCDEFLDSPPSSARAPVATISFSGLQIRFSRLAGNESYAVQTSAGPQWYELRRWRADQVLKREKDLLAH